MRGPSTEAIGAQVKELVDVKIAERTRELERQLAVALRAIEAMKRSDGTDARLARALGALEEIKQHQEKRKADLREVARNARIARAAQSADMTVDEWLAYCRKRRRDPTLFLEVNWPRKRKHAKARTSG